MPQRTETSWHAAFVDLVRRTHSCTGDELPVEINAAIRDLGLTVTVYLVDHEQRRLHPVPAPARKAPRVSSTALSPPAQPGGCDGSLLVDGGPAGLAFTSVSTVHDTDADDVSRLWVAMVDGSERLGVVEFVARPPVEDPEALQRHCVTLAGLIGHLVATKTSYGDTLTVIRRQRPMSVAAELLLSILPPLTFTSRRIAVSAVLEPAYECGGDAYDYAVEHTTAQVTVLDAMGRGLPAGIGAAVALAGLRAARRAGGSIEEMALAADAALSEQFAGRLFVTGVVTELNLETGMLRYLNAGHPEPLLLRGGRAVGSLSGGRRLPLGLPEKRVEASREILRPGDRVLMHTDGVTEARDLDGRVLGLDGLVALITEAAFAAHAAPETLRRLANSVLRHHPDTPSDDVTLLLVEWSTTATERTHP